MRAGAKRAVWSLLALTGWIMLGLALGLAANGDVRPMLFVSALCFLVAARLWSWAWKGKHA